MDFVFDTSYQKLEFNNQPIMIYYKLEMGDIPHHRKLNMF